jgi:hypothetical protein
MFLQQLGPNDLEYFYKWIHSGAATTGFTVSLQQLDPMDLEYFYKWIHSGAATTIHL